jgi:hypothetical protein
MADDECLAFERSVIDYVERDSRLLKVAQQEGLKPEHFRKPKLDRAYRRFIEHPNEPPNTDRPIGATHVRKWAQQLVAAHSTRPPWVEPVQPQQPAIDAQPPQRAKQQAADPKPRSRKQSKRHSDERQNDRQVASKKEIPREILWLNQVLLDVEHAEKPAMPTNCFRVAYVISQLWNPKTDDAWPAQSRIGEILKLDRTTVSHLIKLLVDHGHAEVKPGKGRGNTSRYRPIIKEPVIRKLIAAEKPSKPTD